MRGIEILSFGYKIKKYLRQIDPITKWLWWIIKPIESWLTSTYLFYLINWSFMTPFFILNDPPPCSMLSIFTELIFNTMSYLSKFKGELNRRYLEGTKFQSCHSRLLHLNILDSCRLSWSEWASERIIKCRRQSLTLFNERFPFQYLEKARIETGI